LMNEKRIAERVAREMVAAGDIKKKTSGRGTLAMMHWTMEVWNTTLKDIKKAYAKIEMESNHEVGTIIQAVRHDEGKKLKVLKDPPRLIARGDKILVVVTAWFAKEDVEDWKMILFNWEH
jgi:hypothetical protein